MFRETVCPRVICCNRFVDDGTHLEDILQKLCEEGTALTADENARSTAIEEEVAYEEGNYVLRCTSCKHGYFNVSCAMINGGDHPTAASAGGGGKDQTSQFPCGRWVAALVQGGEGDEQREKQQVSGTARARVDTAQYS